MNTGLTVEQWSNGAYRDSAGVEVGTPEGDVETTIEVGPNVDSVVYSVYGSQDAAILAMKNGEIDYVINPLGLQRGLADQIKTDPNLTVLENNVNGFRYMSFNNRRRPMNDCAFRQAVAVLIDKEFVTGTILQGVAFPLYTFVPEANTAWYFDDVPKLGQGLTREQRTNLAVAILEQAGYTWEGDVKPTWDPDGRAVNPGGHLIMPDGTPVPELNIPAPSPGYDPLRSTFAIWIETWLKEFGVPATAQLAGFNVIVPIIFTEQDFDMYLLGWSLGLFPDYLRDFFAEEQAVQDGNNAGGYVNAKFEELSEGILSCESFETCKEISDEIQLMLATEVPYVLLFDTGIIEGYRSASLELPYEETLSGLQYAHQYGGELQASVKVR
jgi:ABC-type transport system substrate-binding protein